MLFRSVITGDAQASWVAETAEKPVSRATLSQKTMTPYKLAVIEPFSDEFRRDLPGLYRELVRRLPFALGKQFDATVYGVTAVPGSNFDSLASAPQVTVDGTNTYQDLVAAFYRNFSVHWFVNRAIVRRHRAPGRRRTGPPPPSLVVPRRRGISRRRPRRAEIPRSSG